MTKDIDIDEQRRRAVRTAWILGIIALMIFTAFVLSGILGS